MEKKPAFFKVLIGDLSTDLKLPPQFAKGFQRCLVNKLPEDRLILSCDGKSWAVEVVNVAKDKVYFREGWKEFVNDNSLGIGGLIVFEYQGDLKFNLDIFGRQCSRKGVSPDIWEKYLPQKGEKPTIGGGQATSELSQVEEQPTMGGGEEEQPTMGGGEEEQPSMGGGEEEQPSMGGGGQGTSGNSRD
ncbi:hypothetical protein COLO4_21352 [Corchorus olitorius]|uniref:TF-B3 domain-containing protein n=1 Tax=Corchorus olitorius TaxID=93759 RepID=A0A1R3ITU6_9ROSI|nr:hypothetical protein COLO4_21352 [Corchorus olitorius]